MKVVILNAGKSPSSKAHKFPVNSKPKCFFHIGGDIILEKQIEILRSVGIEFIRIVTGYKSKEIEDFIITKGIKDVEIIYNPLWKTDSLSSLKLGLKDIDDDVLVITGDTYFSKDELLMMLNSKSQLAMNWNFKKPKANLCMWKFSKEKLHLISELDNFQRDRWKDGCNGGAGILWPIREMFAEYEAEKIDLVMFELDYYKDSDECKEEKK